jgi:hypothetical protein
MYRVMYYEAVCGHLAVGPQKEPKEMEEMNRFYKWVTRVRVVYIALVNYYVKWKPGRAACADKRIKGANR